MQYVNMFSGGGGGGGGGGMSGGGGVGQAVGGFLGIAGSFVDWAKRKKLAEKQEALAKKHAAEAMGMSKESLRPEYAQALAQKYNMAGGGLASYDTQKDLIGSSTANTVQDLLRAGGGNAGIAAALGQQNKSLLQLSAADEEAKMRNINSALETQMAIGAEERRLEQERTRKRENLLKQSSGEADASAKNIIDANSSLYKGLGSAASTLFGGGGSGTEGIKDSDPASADYSGMSGKTDSGMDYEGFRKKKKMEGYTDEEIDNMINNPNQSQDMYEG